VAYQIGAILHQGRGQRRVQKKNTPSLRLFGWLGAFAMIAALVADLLILRLTAMFLMTVAERWRRRG
jgi:hypothetical protein